MRRSNPKGFSLRLQGVDAYKREEPCVLQKKKRKFISQSDELWPVRFSVFCSHLVGILPLSIELATTTFIVGHWPYFKIQFRRNSHKKRGHFRQLKRRFNSYPNEIRPMNTSDFSSLRYCINFFGIFHHKSHVLMVTYFYMSVALGVIASS